MTVYLLVDGRPQEFGGFTLVSIYQHRAKAAKRLATLQKKDPCLAQYMTVQPCRVITGRALPRRIR